MFVYSILICTVLRFVNLAIDIVAFFLVVRAVVLLRRISWLEPFDKAGTALVDSYTGFVGRLWSRIAHRCLATRGKLLIGLTILELARILLLAAARLLS
jgi:hypothetical protein